MLEVLRRRTPDSDAPEGNCTALEGKKVSLEMREQISKLGKVVKTYSETCKNCVETIFFILAIAWALYVFAYTGWYLPSIERPQVVPTVQLEKVCQKEKAVALAATVKVKNTGKVKIRVISALFNIKGCMVVQRGEESNDQLYSGAARNELKIAQDNGWDVDIIRHYKKVDWKSLQSGNLLQESWLEPGEEYERIFNAYVPEGIELVRMELNVWIAREATFIRTRTVNEKIKSELRIDDKVGTLSPVLSINNCILCSKDNWEDLNTGKESHREFLSTHGIQQNDSSVELSLW